MVNRSIACGMVLVLLLAGGCRRPSASSPEPEPLYHLPLLKQSRDPKLREHFQRLSRRGELPWQLRDVPVPPAENAAEELAQLFPTQKPQQVFDSLAGFFPASPLLEDALRLEQAAAQVRRWQEQLQRARRAMLRPRCVFAIPYDKCLEAELSFIYRVRAAARLAVLQAVEAAAGQRPEEALDHLLLALRLAAALQGHKHPVVQLQAALARAEALEALQGVLSRFSWSSGQLGRVLDVLQRAKADLPSDAQAWVVDRTLGLHFYELLRAGAWNQIITPKDLDRLGTQLAQRLRFATQATLQQDEAYYLDAMEQLIALAARPYHQRRADLTRLEKKWRADAQRYPAAAVLLLPDVLPGMAQQALDRARLQGWILGLQQALGREGPQVVLSPFTGRPYQIIQRQRYLVVLGTGAAPGQPEVPILVPKLSVR